MLTPRRSPDEAEAVYARTDHFDPQGPRGWPVGELARRYGVVENTIYRWKSKYGGMEISDARRLRELEHENARLKRLLAGRYPRYGYLTLHEMLKQDGRVNPPT